MKSFCLVQFLLPCFSNFLHELLRFLQSLLDSIRFDALHLERELFQTKSKENQHFRKRLILTERDISQFNHKMATRISFAEVKSSLAIHLSVNQSISQSHTIIRKYPDNAVTSSIQLLASLSIKQHNIIAIIIIILIIILIIRPVLPQ